MKKKILVYSGFLILLISIGVLLILFGPIIINKIIYYKNTDNEFIEHIKQDAIEKTYYFYHSMLNNEFKKIDKLLFRDDGRFIFSGKRDEETEIREDFINTIKLLKQEYGNWKDISIKNIKFSNINDELGGIYCVHVDILVNYESIKNSEKLYFSYKKENMKIFGYVLGNNID